MAAPSTAHPREGGDPWFACSLRRRPVSTLVWIPAFAGMVGA